MATNNENAQKSQDGVQPEVDVTNKSIIPQKINQYILETSVYPTEPEPLKEIRELTMNHPLCFIASSPDVLQLLGLLIRLINAKNTIEVGVFTGHSVLASALALPDDGKILALDITREHYEMGLPAIQKAGVEHKIDFREGAALPFLDQLVKEGKSNGKFDFAFVDADKGNYLNYHQRIIELVRVGGLIAYDNTLWCGSVTGKYEGPHAHLILPDRDAVVEFNKTIAIDPRVQICQISIGDGVTLCRRIS